jgi:hypothetical protein
MSKTIYRTIAFQVDDADFLREYDLRQKESGLSVKNYFISLIKADIAMHQVPDTVLTQEGGENAETVAPEQEETAEGISAEPDETAATQDLGAEQAAETGLEQAQVGNFVQSEEMMNLFVKITREQRESLEAHKLETGETVGNVLNRIIDKFLDCADSLPEGFDDAYKHYSANPKFCDTTCSAKIPVRVNQELTGYLNSFGGSRNALMASLVELELKDQEMAETPDEDQSAGMTM